MSRPPLTERLAAGLEEAIQFTRGELSLRTVELPGDPPAVSPQDIVALRHRVEMSQAVFARVLSVSTRTIQSWEQGLRRPSQSSLRLLQVFQSRPDVMCEIVGLHPTNRDLISGRAT